MLLPSLLSLFINKKIMHASFKIINFLKIIFRVPGKLIQILLLIHRGSKSSLIFSNEFQYNLIKIYYVEIGLQSRLLIYHLPRPKSTISFSNLILFLNMQLVLLGVYTFILVCFETLMDSSGLSLILSSTTGFHNRN